MCWRIYCMASLLFCSPRQLRRPAGRTDARESGVHIVPELASGCIFFTPKLRQSRKKFAEWESQNPDETFGHGRRRPVILRGVYRQGVLSMISFDDKRFLNGIDGNPIGRMKSFRRTSKVPEKLARQRLEKDARAGRAFRSRTFRRNGIDRPN